MGTGSRESGNRFQIRLLDLFIVVIGAAYVFDVARRSKIVWGGGWPDFAHAVGLMVLSLGVIVTLVLVVQWAARLKKKEGRAWASVWRVIAVGWLVGALVEIASILQMVSSPGMGLVGTVLNPLRLRLDSVTAILGMVGLILAVVPLRTCPARMSRRPEWGYLPSIIWALSIGMTLLVLGHGMYPYLVLLALEAVHNAMRLAPLVKRPIVFDRMLTASLEALPGLIGCVITAAWVDEDMRASVRDPSGARTPRPWSAWLARASTVILAGVGVIYVVTISIPALSPALAEGLSIILDPSQVATVCLGFAAFAAGLAARTAAYLTTVGLPFDPALSDLHRPRKTRWFQRVIAGVAGLFSLEITLAAIRVICRDDAAPWYVPIDFSTWKSIFRLPDSWVIIPSGNSPWNRLIENPDDFVVGISAVWLTVRLAGLIAGKSAIESSPMDLLATDDLALRRFFGWWFALTTAMLACMPGLTIIAVTILHFVIRWTAN